MGFNFTSDLLSLFDTKVGNDANYEAPGNFGLAETLLGSVGVDHATIGTAGTYTTVPTATASGGVSSHQATFQTRMKLLSGSTIAAAGTGYTPLTDILTLTGGTKTTSATVTVATVKLVSATIAAGGTGYGVSSTFTVSVFGGTHSVIATVSVTTDGSGIVTTINSVNAAGNYTILPTLAANAVTGDNGTDHGSNLTLNLVFGVNTVSVSQAGVYTALPANPISVTGGTGAGFQLTGSWGVVSLGVTDPGAYETATAPTITFGSGAAAATAVLATASSQDTDEKKLLTMIEIFRSLIAELNNPAQAKDLHEVLRKMMMAMKFGGASTFDASVMAQNALTSGMRYLANNPKHAGAVI